MTLRRPILFWGLCFLVFAGVLYILSDILLPFVAGMALAYCLDPLADRLQRLGLGRLAATCVILTLFALIFIAVLVVLLPLLGSQIFALAERLPSHIEKLVSLVNAASPDWLKQIIAKAIPSVENGLGDLATQGAMWLAAFAKSVWSGGIALVSFLALFFVTPVVAFYLLYDWDRMVAKINKWLPRDHAPTIRKLWREIDAALAGFMRGQATVCLILAAFYAVSLTVIGLDFSLLIGLGAGALSFVPYVGATIGIVVSVGVAIVQFWPDWLNVALVLGIFLFGQIVEGNILSPKLVGGSVGLHPVWMIFALFAFGALFGFVGLLVAVPVAAAIGVLTRFALTRYLASPLYLGSAAKPPKTRKNARRKS